MALALVRAVSNSASWPPPATSAAGRFHVWSVEFARFFHFPRDAAANAPPGLLRPLTRAKMEAAGGGSWVAAASPAALHLLINPIATLVVILHGKILEEHFISSLNFSWPQVACSAGCPIRGSRVVFASFKDSNDQVQKFAMRFSASCEAEIFLEALKESSKGPMEIGFTGNEFGSEISSQSEYMITDGLQPRAGDISSLENQNACHNRASDISSLENENACYNQVIPEPNVQNNMTYTPQPLADENSENLLFPSLPPSFTALLNECSHENAIGSGKLSMEEMNADRQQQALHEVDIVAQIRISCSRWRGLWMNWKMIWTSDHLLFVFILPPHPNFGCR